MQVGWHQGAWLGVGLEVVAVWAGQGQLPSMRAVCGFFTGLGFR